MKWQLIKTTGSRLIKVKPDKEATGIMVFAGKAGNYEVEVDLVKSGAKALILGLAMGKAKDKIKLTVNTRHQVKNTHAETMIYGINQDESETEVKGLIVINKLADLTTDFLTMKVLLLSDKARARVDPGLEIKADEVRASHAASVSAIDKQQLFYLMSRGLTEAEAEGMIVAGFVKNILDRIDSGKIKDQLRKEIANVGYGED